jgi:hypothetical protein
MADYRVKTSEQPSVRPEQPKSSAQGSPGPAAILVVHGMGQQIPFQTLGDLAKGLTGKNSHPAAATVTLGDQRLQRIELTVALPGGRTRDVHIYEAYWAPFTEGNVSLRDVAGFLFRSGIGGVVSGVRPFERWIFGRSVRFPAPVRAVLYLVTALAVLLSLAVLNTLIAAVSAARLPLHDAPRWLSRALFADLTTVLNLLVCALIVFGISILTSKLLRRFTALRMPLGALSIVTFVTALWATIAAAVLAVLVVLYHVNRPEAGAVLVDPIGPSGYRVLSVLFAGAAVVALLVWAGHVVREVAQNLEHNKPSRWFTLVVCVTFLTLFGSLAWAVASAASGLSGGVWTGRLAYGIAWPILVVFSLVARHFLIQYVGDVAVYVQPQVLDRFHDLRKRIKDTVWRAAHAVYSAHEYRDVILVGHSLGSVVIYDVLNRLLLDRALGMAHAPDVASRTRLLLTFGSPLDKTAFIFGGQGDGSEAREALAASLQPLIVDGHARPVWVNLYSRWDIISGALDYYDLPDHSNPNWIKNEIDPDATTFLAAHVEYWTGKRLFTVLREHL